MAKKEVELDFDAFVASIENWDGVNPPFDEVMRSALLQAVFVRSGDNFARLLASKVEMVPLSSMGRYAAGISRPLPGLMKVLVREARVMLIAMREQSAKENAELVLFMRSVGNCDEDD